MLRKLSFIALGVLVSIAAFAKKPAKNASQPAEEQGEVVERRDTLGIHPYEVHPVFHEDEVHWSIYIPVGFTFADMDEAGGAKLGSGINNLTLNGGIGVEYNFTPLWGLGAEFNVSHYGTSSFTTHKDDNGFRVDKNGKPGSLGIIYDMSLYGTFDFADAFFPNRQRTLVNVYGLLGFGMGVYTFQSKYDDSFSSTRGLKGYNFDPFVQFGVKVDFNVTRQFGLGVRATYNYYMSDNLDYSATAGSAGDKVGRINSNNDGLFMADLVFRYKIEGHERSHVRNMPRGTYDDIQGKKMVAKYAPMVETGAAHRVDTIYVMGRDTVIREIASSSMIAAAEHENVYYVYFDNDKTNLTEKSLMTIQQVAEILASDTTLGIQVGGFADNTGNAERNAYLCEHRAKNVMDEFVHEHGIEPERIEARPMGVVVGRRSVGTYAPNRRVTIYLVPKKDLQKNFLIMKKNKSQKEELLDRLQKMLDEVEQ